MNNKFPFIVRNEKLSNSVPFLVKNHDEKLEYFLDKVSVMKISKNKENKNINEKQTDQSNLEEKKDGKEIIDKKIEEENEEENGNEEGSKNEIEIEIKNEEHKFGKKLLGRKKAISGEIGKHNKFVDDNLRRKSKHIILNSLMNFINEKIANMYKGDIGQGMLIKKLLTLNHQQKANSMIQYNKDFLSKTLMEIFSENISTRYSNYPPEHNRNLIAKLLNEIDEEKRIYFNNIFKLTFRQCLNHFNKKNVIYELNGVLKIFDKEIEKYKNEPDYKECLEYYLKNFEFIINHKKSRTRNSENKKKKIKE